ncbi:hypothetical protein Tco_1343070 [Tanacetum coccineum]
MDGVIFTPPLACAVRCRESQSTISGSSEGCMRAMSDLLRGTAQRREENESVTADDRHLSYITVLETEVHRHEWQRQAADDLAVQHIMRTQALEAGARVDTLEDTGSSS